MTANMDATVELIEINEVKRASMTPITCSYLSKTHLFWGDERGGVYALHLKHGVMSKLGSHMGRVISIVYCPHEDIELLFSGSSDQKIAVWNVLDENKIQELGDHENSVMCLDYIGDMIISGSIDKEFMFFKVDKKRQNAHLEPMFERREFFEVNLKKKDWITCVWTDKGPPGTQADIIVGDNIGNMFFMKSEHDTTKEGTIKNVVMRKRKKFKFGILFVDVSNIYVIICFNNNSIVLFDVSCRTMYHTIDIKYKITRILYHKEGKEIDEIILTAKDSLQIYNLNRNRIVFRKRYGENINDVMLQGDRIFLQKPYKFGIYEVRRTIPFIKCKAHNDPVVGLVALPKPLKRERLKEEKEELRVISVSQDSTVAFWDVNQYEFKLDDKMTIRKKKSEIYCFLHLPPKHIVTGHSKGWINFLNYKTKKLAWYKPHENTVSALHVFQHKEKDMLITGCFDGYVVLAIITYLINLDRDPRFEYKMICSETAVLSLSFSSVKDLVVVGNTGGILGFYTTGFQKVRRFKAHEEGVSDLQIDGVLLFSASEDGTVKMWDLNNFNLLQEYSFHDSEINCMRLIPEKFEIVTSDRMGRLIRWNYKNRKVLFEYQKKSFEISEVRVKKNIIFAGTGTGLVLKIIN